MAKLIFGCGYLGERVARRWREFGNKVVVVTRSEERTEEFKQRGFGAIVADVTQPDTLTDLPAADMVLFAVGFDRAGAQSIVDVYEGGVQNVLPALPPGVSRFIYISTTGVYGPAGGDWVDEQTPTDPQRDGGRASLAAEHALAAHSLGRNGIVLRLAGIYGPGRIPFLNELRAGAPIPAPSAGYLNLIHVDDAVGAVLAAEQLPKFDDGPRIYCVSDGHPVERAVYYREVARQIGAPPVSFVDPPPDSTRAARARANRRVRNERMMRDFKINLAYPHYRAGLAAILTT